MQISQVFFITVKIVSGSRLEIIYTTFIMEDILYRRFLMQMFLNTLIVFSNRRICFLLDGIVDARDRFLIHVSCNPSTNTKSQSRRTIPRGLRLNIASLGFPFLGRYNFGAVGTSDPFRCIFPVPTQRRPPAHRQAFVFLPPATWPFRVPFSYLIA